MKTAETPRTAEELRAFIGALVDEHYTEIYTFLARLARGGNDAPDLAQETFLKAFRSCQQLRDADKARAWLYRIAWTTFLNSRRGRRGRRLESLDAAPEVGDSRPGAEATLLDGESRRRLRLFVEQLPIRQRTAFVLRKTHGLEYAEVSETLGCSPEAARANVSEALKKVRAFCRQEGMLL